VGPGTVPLNAHAFIFYSGAICISVFSKIIVNFLVGLNPSVTLFPVILSSLTPFS
jgi:hypothetical protein